MKHDFKLQWVSGSTLPIADRCVLIYDKHSDCMFTAYHDGECWRSWGPGAHLNPDDEKFDFRPSEWAYLTSDQYNPTLCDRPPIGWSCSREPGHSGPCAASADDWTPTDASDLSSAIAVIEDLTAQCGKTLEQRVLKLTEETGEVARALLIATGSPGAKYRDRKEGIDELVEECADVFIVVMSILYHHLGQSYPEYSSQFIDMLGKKLGKWKHILELESNLNDGDR